MKEYIIYEGEEFVIEWYYGKKGESPSLEYFMNLTNSRQDKTLFLFKRMGDFGKIHNKTQFRYEGNEVFAFKPQPDRFLCFFVKGRKIVVTNAFHKKSNKLPKGEKERALKYRDDYLKRIKDGDYYE